MTIITETLPRLGLKTLDLKPTSRSELLKSVQLFIPAIAKLPLLNEGFLDSKGSNDILPPEDCIPGLPKGTEEIYESKTFAKILKLGNPELAQQTETEEQEERRITEEIIDRDEDLLMLNLEDYNAEYGGVPLAEIEAAEELRQEAAQRAADKSKRNLESLRKMRNTGVKAVVSLAAATLVALPRGSQVLDQNALTVNTDFTQETTEVFQNQEVFDQEAFLMNRLEFLVTNFHNRVRERREEMQNINANPYTAPFLREVARFEKAGEEFREEILETYSKLQIPGAKYPGGAEAKIAEMEELIVILDIFNTTYFPGANLGMLSDFFDRSMRIEPGILYWMKTVLYQREVSNASEKLPFFDKKNHAQMIAYIVWYYLNVELPSSQNPQIVRNLHEYGKSSEIFVFHSTSGQALRGMLEQGLIPAGTTVVCANLNVSAKILDLMKSREDIEFLIINAETDEVLEKAEILNSVDEFNKLYRKIALNSVLAGVTQVYDKVLNPGQKELLGLVNFPDDKVNKNVSSFKHSKEHSSFFNDKKLFKEIKTAISILHNKWSANLEQTSQAPCPDCQPTKKIDACWEFEAGKIIPKQDQFPKSNLAGSGNGFINSLREE